MIRCGKNLTLAELQDIVENEWSENESDDSTNCDKVALKNAQQLDVVIVPPELVDALSDSEHIDDEIVGDRAQEGQIVQLQNVNEIAGGAELHAMFNEMYDPEDDLPLSFLRGAQTVPLSHTSENPEPKWRNRPSGSAYSNAPVDMSHECLKTLAEKYEHFSPLELFELFIDDEIIEFIVECTNFYASVDKTDQNFRTDPSEIKKFIGILFLTVYHTLSSIRCYWSKKPSLGIELVKMAMTRDRFTRIKSYFHVCKNDDLNVNDKFAKVAPFNNLLNKKFMQFGMFAHHLSIDEQMIAYYGKHSCKMFIRGKPIRFGFKYWDLCSSDGYLFQFQPYAGANTNNKNGYGLGENVVMQLLQHCEVPNNHTVAFDNFFTSWKLMARLSKEGFFAVGTVRESRTGKAKLVDSKAIVKRDRGAIDYCYDQNNDLLAVRWNDNAVR